jgi:hypothetical protein
MYLYACAAGYTDERIADAGPPHTRAHVLRPCARARACAIGRPRIRADTCERVPSAWTAGGAARQAFYYGAFNANIGAWNTARVTNLYQVCPAFPAQAVRHRGRDLLGRVVDAARAVERGGDRRCARACVCADAWARACAGVHVCRYSCAYERRDTCMYVCIYVCICVYRYLYMHVCIINLRIAVLV